MANPEYSESVSESYLGNDLPGGGAVSATMGWVGAACSLALMGGLGWWTYDLVQRDVNGIPVVAALEGPSRIAPKEPGGIQVAHQGLAVNAIATRAEVPPVEEVRLAPKPTALEAQDQPIAALRPQARQKTLADAVADALADAGVLSAAPVAVAEDNSTVAVAAPAPVGGEIGTYRPRPRPEMSIVTRAAPAELVPVSASLPLDIDPATIASGTRLVQLGAYDSMETARAEWDRALTRFGPFLDGKQRVIEQTERGGKVFYRLRVHGFADLADSRRFCAALEAERADCIPVLVR